MNIIAGWIVPEMNWARKLAAYSVSLCSAKVCSDSFARPKTFTSECPVYISSMWPLSWPVVRHCLTNCGWARLPIRAATTTDTGTVTSAITASSGEITHHHGQHADDGQQRRDDLAERLLHGLGDVVDVVGDPAEHLAVRLAVEVAQRQPGELGLACSRSRNVQRCTIRVASRACNSPNIAANDVDQRHQQQYLPDLAEVDAASRDEVQRVEHVGELAVALGAQPARRCRPSSHRPGTAG